MRDSAEIIKQFFDRETISEGEGWVKFISSWNKLVGQDLAAHIRVKDLTNGILFLNCDHPGWAQIFYLKKSAILKKLNKQFPQLSVNSFRVYCDNKNISKDIVEKAKIIEQVQKPRQVTKKTEIDPEFSSVLENLRNLGN